MGKDLCDLKNTIKSNIDQASNNNTQKIEELEIADENSQDGQQNDQKNS